MKVLANLANGAVQIIEDGGVVTLSINESASVGGGDAAGIVKVQGVGSVVLNAQQGLKLGEALLNAHLPASVQPLAAAVEGIVNTAIAAIE